MPLYLGIDTSNYTTSAAVYDSGGRILRHARRLLEVREGERGLRQSETLFQHTRALPSVLEQVCSAVPPPYRAVGASARPRDIQGSYMPCFLAGVSAAEAAARAAGIRCFHFSHQSGHVAAALYSAQRLDLIEQKFIAFHVSGGTTEALMVSPDPERVFLCRKLAGTLDLNAGQVIDRVGVMMGLRFPCGAELERLALQSERHAGTRPSIRGCDCSLSGVENQCRDRFVRGESREDVARFCIESVRAALDRMAENLLREYGEHELVFSGGVMSNTIIRSAFTQKYGACFAEPEFSCDNAAGIAILTSLKTERE